MSIMPSVQETPSYVQRVGNFFATGLSILLPCTTTSGSSAVLFPAIPDGLGYCTDVEISNLGTVPVWIAFGGTSSLTVAIPTAGVPANGRCLIPGGVVTWCKGTNGFYVAGITQTSTASVYIDQGYGS